MHVRGPNNTDFQLRIIGYEFPETKHERYDSDWLNIAIRVTDPRGSWSSTAPMLLTWEVAQLADWLDTLTVNRSERLEVSFLEPNLRLSIVEDNVSHVTIRVYFEQESRPPWDPSRFGFSSMDVVWIELQPSVEELLAAAAALRRELLRFPIRVGRPASRGLDDATGDDRRVR